MKMIFDSDCILAGTKIKNEILDRILKTRKRITVIHGVAGSGKSTVARKYGDQVIDLETDLSKADEFIIISGASANKSGGPSDALANLIRRANEVIFIMPSNDEIIRRRYDRIEVGAIDKRSDKQIKATLRAPLKDLRLICNLKKLAKKTVIMR